MLIDSSFLMRQHAGTSPWPPSPPDNQRGGPPHTLVRVHGRPAVSSRGLQHGMASRERDPSDAAHTTMGITDRLTGTCRETEARASGRVVCEGGSARRSSSAWWWSWSRRLFPLLVVALSACVVLLLRENLSLKAQLNVSAETMRDATTREERLRRAWLGFAMRTAVFHEVGGRQGEDDGVDLLLRQLSAQRGVIEAKEREVRRLEREAVEREGVLAELHARLGGVMGRLEELEQVRAVYDSFDA